MEIKDLPPHILKHLEFARNWVGPKEDTFLHMFVSYSDKTMDVFAIENTELFESVCHRIMLDEKKIGLVEDATLISEGWAQIFEAPPGEPDPETWPRRELERRRSLYGQRWSEWPKDAQKKYLQDTLRIDSASREQFFHIAITIERDGKTVKLLEDKARVETKEQWGGMIGRHLCLIFKSQQIHDAVYGSKRS